MHVSDHVVQRNFTLPLSTSSVVVLCASLIWCDRLEYIPESRTLLKAFRHKGLHSYNFRNTLHNLVFLTRSAILPVAGLGEGPSPLSVGISPREENFAPDTACLPVSSNVGALSRARQHILSNGRSQSTAPPDAWMRRRRSSTSIHELCLLRSIFSVGVGGADGYISGGASAVDAGAAVVPACVSASVGGYDIVSGTFGCASVYSGVISAATTASGT